MLWKEVIIINTKPSPTPKVKIQFVYSTHSVKTKAFSVTKDDLIDYKNEGYRLTSV